MKKTLAALIVYCIAASAANAAVVYDNEGTKVELGGSLRLIMEKADKKNTTALTTQPKKLTLLYVMQVHALALK